MEIVIIGGIAAGMSTAAKAARENPDATITVIEKENYISFGACGLPYYLGEQFEDSNIMFARTVEQMQKAGITVKTGYEVTSISYDDKIVYYENVETKEKQTKSYDRLMIATGAKPIVPPIEDVDAENIYTFTRLKAVDAIKDQLDEVEHVTIVGGGFIGVEVAEQLAHLNKKITLVEGLEHIMSAQFDPDFSKKIQTALEDEGIDVLTNEMVKGFSVVDGKATTVQTSTKEIPTDLVILAVGFTPNTDFAKDDKLEMLDNGAIKINSAGETSIPDVFAAGDCASSPHRQLGDIYLPLATVANKYGRIIGVNIVSDADDYQHYPGSLGTGAVKAGKYEAGRTGLSEKEAKELDIAYKITSITAKNHTGYWPGQEPIDIKLVYEADTKKLLGAQIFGKKDAVLRMTGLTTAIHAGLTTDEIGFIDYAYAPPFATTWEAINIAANTAK